MMQDEWILYIHTVPKEITGYDFDKYYVGITKDSFERRCRKDGSGYKAHTRKKKQTYWWSAICKYGWDNIRHEVIKTHLTKEEACNLEREYIKKLKSNDYKHGYNGTSGGEGTHDVVCSKEVRELRSRMAKERWKNDPAFRSAHIGKNCSFHYKRVSFKGADNPRCKKVICLNNGEIYSWCGEAAEKYKLDIDQVRNACRGRSKGAGIDSNGNRCKWQYYNDYLMSNT